MRKFVVVHLEQKTLEFLKEWYRMCKFWVIFRLAKNNRILSIIDDAFSEIRNEKDEKRLEVKETNYGKKMFWSWIVE